MCSLHNNYAFYTSGYLSICSVCSLSGIFNIQSKRMSRIHRVSGIWASAYWKNAWSNAPSPIGRVCAIKELGTLRAWSSGSGRYGAALSFPTSQEILRPSPHKQHHHTWYPSEWNVKRLRSSGNHEIYQNFNLSPSRQRRAGRLYGWNLSEDSAPIVPKDLRGQEQIGMYLLFTRWPATSGLQSWEPWEPAKMRCRSRDGAIVFLTWREKIWFGHAPYVYVDGSIHRCLPLWPVKNSVRWER